MSRSTWPKRAQRLVVGVGAAGALLCACGQQAQRATPATGPRVDRGRRPVTPARAEREHPAAQAPAPESDPAARADAERRAAMEEAARQAREGVPEPSFMQSSRVDVMLTVTLAAGLRGVAAGTTCNLSVQFGQTVNGRHCRAVIDCADLAVYGARERAGFFACTAFSTDPPLVIGTDSASSSSDGDPRFAIDTTMGTLSLSDDARGALGRFSLSGTTTVTSRSPPPPP